MTDHHFRLGVALFFIGISFLATGLSTKIASLVIAGMWFIGATYAK